MNRLNNDGDWFELSLPSDVDEFSLLFELVVVVAAAAVGFVLLLLLLSVVACNYSWNGSRKNSKMFSCATSQVK